MTFEPFPRQPTMEGRCFVPFEPHRFKRILEKCTTEKHTHTRGKFNSLSSLLPRGKQNQARVGA